MAARGKLPTAPRHPARLTHRKQHAVRGLIRGCLVSILAGFALLVGVALWSGSRAPAPSPTPAPIATPAPSAADPVAAQPEAPSSTAAAASLAPSIDPPAQAADLTAPEALAISGIHPAIIESASRHGSADAVPVTDAAELRLGTVAQLDRADVIGLTPAGIQLSLPDGSSAFLVGVSTRGLVSGAAIAPGLVLVEDTTTFATVLDASRTGWQLRAITTAEWSEALAAVRIRGEVEHRNRLRAELRDLQAELDNPPAYEFRSADGQFATNAAVLSFDRDAQAYTLRRVDDGRELLVPQDRLDRESIARARTVAAKLAKSRRRIEAIEAELLSSANNAAAAIADSQTQPPN